MAAAADGVAVTILLEGGPPGGITDQEHYGCGLIENAGGACWFTRSLTTSDTFTTTSPTHAKYAIIDGTVAAVGSEILARQPAQRR